MFSLAIAATDTGAAAASTIDLQALSVSVQYEARLQGESWSTVCDGGGECHFSIPNLAPGTYQVEVRAQLSLDNYAAVTTHRWVVDTCGEEQYASYDAGSGAVACAPCPTGADCSGNTTALNMRAKAGWWGGSLVSDPPLARRLGEAEAGAEGDTTQAAAPVFYKCLVAGACQGGGANGNTTGTACGAGYTGPLCGVCQHGYFSEFGRCQPCTVSQGTAYVALVLLCVACVAGAGVLYKLRRHVDVGRLRVVAMFGQSLGFVTTSFLVPWPSAVRTFLNGFMVLDFAFMEVSKASCFHQTPFHESLFSLLLAVSLVAAGLASVAWWARRRSPNPGSSKAWLRLLIGWLVVCYVPVSNAVLRVFDCVQVHGQWMLRTDLREGCLYNFGAAPRGTAGWWPAMALVASIVCVAYVIGLPGAVAAFSRHRSPSNKVRRGMCAGMRRCDCVVCAHMWPVSQDGYAAVVIRSFYRDLRRGAEWWQAAEMARLVVLTSLVVPLDHDTVAPVRRVVLWSSCVLMSHLRHWLLRNSCPLPS